MLRKASLPGISIVTCNFNSDVTIFEKSLQSLATQKYPRKLIEHIVMDGGSTNQSVALAKKYNCRIFISPKLKTFAQKRMALGILKARHELILIMEPDNILVGTKWLKKMVFPFQENKSIFCTFTAYHGYEKSMSMLTKYTALYGSPDPTLFYLNKTEKIPLTKKIYDKGTMLSEQKNYYTVQFSPQDLPTLGDNGHMFRGSILKRVVDPETFTHTDAVMDMVLLGNKTFGVVKEKIIHVTDGTLLSAIKKRIEYKQQFYDARRGKRKYLVFDWHSKRDIKNLFKFILFSLTCIEPLSRSILGYIKIPEKTWFIHPIFSFCMVIGYGYTEIILLVKKNKTRH